MEKNKKSRFLLVLAVSGLIMSIGIIAVLLFVLNTMEKRLEDLGDLMEEMSDSRIEYLMTISEIVPVRTDAEIPEQITVGIDLVVTSSIPFTAYIPISEKMMIPINLGITDKIYVDTLISIVGDVRIQVKDTIPLDQHIRVKGLKIPAKAQIPLNQELTVSFDEQIRMQSYIPIHMAVKDQMSVDLNMSIPVDVMVPVKIPVKTTAKITFLEPLPFKADIPITLDVPVDIPLNETAMGKYLKEVAKGMRGLVKL